MRVSLKYKGDVKDNYTRFGRRITTKETVYDIYREFGAKDKKDAERLVSSLESDSKLFCKIHRSG